MEPIIVIATRHVKEPWEDFDFSVTSYCELLDSIGCDQFARQGLFLLASFGDAGRMAANDVLSKVVKKLADQDNAHAQPVRNWSAFIHKASLAWRHTIQQQQQQQQV